MILDDEALLDQCLERWVEIQLETREEELALLASCYDGPSAVIEQSRKAGRRLVGDQAAQVRPFLSEFLKDHLTTGPDELEQLASALSPGGAHTGGLLTQIIWRNLFWPNPLLVAAAVRYNWHGGKQGSQFMPNPADTTRHEYEEEAWELLQIFDRGTDCDPRRILTGADLDFFDSLPERFTVYRGCAGISVEQAALGVCWTTSKDVGEWFALRTARRMHAKAILLTARVRKDEVRITKAVEFEVVTIPRRARAIKCQRRPDAWQPDMEWKPKRPAADMDDRTLLAA